MKVCDVCNQKPCEEGCPGEAQREAAQSIAVALRSRSAEKNILSRYGLLSEVDGAYLLPWHRRYAEWVGLQTSTTVKEREEKIRLIMGRTSGTAMADGALRKMVESRPDYKAYLRSLQEDDVAAARAKLRSGMSNVVGYHLEAVENLGTTKDYDLLHKYTAKIVDQLMPKDKTATAPTTQITVNIGPKGFAAAQIIAGEIQDGDFEVIHLENKPSLTP